MAKDLKLGPKKPDTENLAEAVEAASRFPTLDTDKLVRAVEAASKISPSYTGKPPETGNSLVLRPLVPGTESKPDADPLGTGLSKGEPVEARAVTSVRSAAELGQSLRAARRDMRLTQQRFADLASVGRRFVSELENGKPTLEIEKVIKVCAYAGIDLYARRR